MNSKKRNPALNICFVAVGVAIIAALAQISIPLPFGVPLTLQTFAIILVSFILGGPRGFLATLVYVMIGAIGVPVFANFTGGAALLFGPTGGFLLSFPILALAVGFGVDLSRKTTQVRRWFLIIFSIVIGILINYLIGTIVFSISTNTGFLLSLTYCVLPFIATDAIKAVLAVVLGIQVRSRVRALA